MVFKFLSGFTLTNEIEEFKSCGNDSDYPVVKINLSENTNLLHITEMTSHAFIHLKMIVVYYDDLGSLKEYLKRFLITDGGGHSYVNELDDLVEMNLGFPKSLEK